MQFQFSFAKPGSGQIYKETLGNWRWCSQVPILGELSDGYSGADIKMLCRDAAMAPMRRAITGKGPEDIRRMKESGEVCVCARTHPCRPIARFLACCPCVANGMVACAPTASQISHHRPRAAMPPQLCGVVLCGCAAGGAQAELVRFPRRARTHSAQRVRHRLGDVRKVVGGVWFYLTAPAPKRSGELSASAWVCAQLAGARASAALARP
jgi:hypothetical protein